jgi:hypothetical protein
VDEPIQDIMHVYMEMSQENYFCSYLKQTKMSFFSLTKSKQRRHPACGEFGTIRRG